MPPPAFSLPAPSRSLLRFLRAQSEGLAFFDSSNGACSLRNTSSSKLRQPTRRLSVSSPQRDACLQAGLLDLNAIVPKWRKQQQRVKITTNEPSGLAGGPRYASDDHTPSVLCKPSWQERIWGTQASREASRAAKRAASLKAEDLPGGGEPGRNGSIFSPSRTQAAKAALEPRLRCTEVDENGEVILVDGEFKKSELIAKVNFQLYCKGSYAMLATSNTDAFYYSMACCLEICERSMRPTYHTFSSAPKPSSSTFSTSKSSSSTIESYFSTSMAPRLPTHSRPSCMTCKGSCNRSKLPPLAVCLTSSEPSKLCSTLSRRSSRPSLRRSKHQ
jgi:hypothetical protein